MSEEKDPNASVALTHVTMVQGMVAVAAVGVLVDKGIISREELIGKVRSLGIRTFGEENHQVTADALTLIERAL